MRCRKTGGKAGSLETRSCLRGCNVWGRKRTSTSTKVDATAEGAPPRGPAPTAVAAMQIRTIGAMRTVS